MQKIMRIISILIIIGFSSCFIAVVEDPASAPSWMRNAYEETLPLSPGGTVQVENVQGGIFIEGWDREEVNVVGEISPRYSSRPGLVWLPRNNREPQVEIDKFENFITVKPGRSENQEDDVIDIYVMVPRFVECKRLFTQNGDVSITDVFGRASVEVESGNIEVLNFSGSLSLTTKKGSITVELFDLHPDDEIMLSAEQGDLIVYLQSDVNALIEGATPSGEFKNSFGGNARLDGDEFSLQLGTEGAKLTLITGEGNVTIEKIEDVPPARPLDRLPDSGTS